MMKSKFRLIPVFVLALLVIPLLSVHAQDKVSVSIWLDATGDSATTSQCYLDNIITPFSDSSSTITMDAQLLPNSWDTTRTALTGGGAPDIVITPGPSFAYTLAQAGYFLPLDDLAKKDGWSDSFIPWALDLGRVDGKLYSLPTEIETMMLYYNKTLFDAHGWKPPTTMDELVALVDQIKAAGIIPFAHANAEWRPADEWFVTSFLNNVAGPDKVYQALKGDLNWDNPDFEKALDILNKFQADGDFMGGLDRYYTATFNESHTALGDGSAAMNIEGSWFLASVSSFFGSAAGNDNDWDWVPVPSTTGDAIYPLGIGSTWSINAKTEHPDESGEFLNYLFSGDTQAKILTTCGVAPAPVKIDPDLLKSLDPRNARLRTALNEAAAKNNYGYTTWTFWPPKSDAYIYDEIEKVWAGTITTKDYLTGLNTLFVQELKDGTVPPLPSR